MIKDALYNNYQKYFFKHSKKDDILFKKVLEYEFTYFDDMLFSVDSIVSEFVKYEYSNDKGNMFTSWADMEMSLDENYFCCYVKRLEDNVEGRTNFPKRMIIVDPKYLDNDSVILHEMIHAYECLINDRWSFYHDILTLCLYKDLISKIPDLDGRILAHTHVLNGDRISRDGGAHDILFFLKSLDLDLRCNFKLGTVCGYGRDQYLEPRAACD